MRLKLRCLSYGLMLVCLAACASNNGVNPQTGNVTTPANAPASGPVVAQSNTGSASDAAAPPASGPASPVGLDACSLMTTKEVAAIQGGAIKDTKGDQRNDGDFLMSQCFYTAEEFVRSVSLSVIQPNPANPARHPQDYFNEKFRDAGKKPEAEREKERDREKANKGKEENKAEGERGAEEEEEEGANVESVGGIGEKAYWVKTGPSAALYVLKNNQFLILSIGGGDAEPIKLKKTKALAQQALKRLK